MHASKLFSLCALLGIYQRWFSNHPLYCPVAHYHNFFFFFGNFRADNLILTSVSYLLITCYQWGSIFYAYALRLFFRTSTKGSWQIFWEFKCPVVIRSLIFLYCWLVWFVRRSFLLWKPSSFSLPCKQKILSHLMSLFSIFFLPDWHIVLCL